jgi:hypothetical protein
MAGIGLDQIGIGFDKGSGVGAVPVCLPLPPLW